MEENPIIAESRKRSLAIKMCGLAKKASQKVGFSWSGEIHSFLFTFYIIYLLNK